MARLGPADLALHVAILQEDIAAGGLLQLHAQAFRPIRLEGEHGHGAAGIVRPAAMQNVIFEVSGIGGAVRPLKAPAAMPQAFAILSNVAVAARVLGGSVAMSFALVVAALRGLAMRPGAAG